MRFKKSLLIICLIICIFAVASVSATDANDTAIATTEDSLEINQATDDVIGMEEDKELASSGTNEVLKADEQIFSQLNATINGNTDNDIYLTSDYKYSSGDDSFKEGIVIDRDVNIYGNGHTINGSGEARIFKVNGGNVVFYNITFVNGDASNSWFDSGGAINGDCKAINCTFKENHASFDGGAMYGGSAVDCIFINNSAENGGAMYKGSAVNCTFTGNSALGGGAMYKGSAVNCTFTQNHARAGGAMEFGSAVNCTFTQNNADHDGGAMHWGSAVNCTFTKNTAEDGGAMYLGSAVNCTFTQNNAGHAGGAMEFGSAVNCTFTQNTAYYGGAMGDCRYLICSGQEEEYVGCDELDLYFDVSDFTSTYNSNEEFLIPLKGQNGPIDFINTDVVVYKDGVEVRRYSCLSGDGVIFDLAAGNYTANLTITYPNLEPKPTTIKLTINKATPKIEVIANESTYPNVVVNVKTDVSGEYMVKVGNKTQNVNLEANVAKDITFTGLAANEAGYNVNVTYATTENYTDAFNDTETVKVAKATPTINVSAVDVTYPGDVVVSVKSDVNGTYIVKIGDKSQNVTLEANVTQNVTFTGLSANESGYVINVTHDSENYTGFNDAVIVKVMKGAVKLTADAVTTTYQVNKNLVITLKDSTGKVLSGAKVTVDLNGAKTYTTDKNGQIKINVAKLVPKTYTAKVTFAGNANYDKSTADVKVTVKKAKPKIIAKKKTYKAKKKVKKFTITLKDNKGKPIKKAKVRLIVKKIKKTSKKKTTNKTKKNKKKNIKKTNKKGKITFKIKRNKKGKYLATVKFYGNKYYAKAVKKVKIKMK